MKTNFNSARQKSKSLPVRRRALLSLNTKITLLKIAAASIGLIACILFVTCHFALGAAATVVYFIPVIQLDKLEQ